MASAVLDERCLIKLAHGREKHQLRHLQLTDPNYVRLLSYLSQSTIRNYSCPLSPHHDRQLSVVIEPTWLPSSSQEACLHWK